jgi:hypothetical protein
MLLAAIVVAVVGFGAGFVTHNLTGESETAGSTAAEATVFDCPHGEVVTAYSPGSRVYAVGRTESSGWVQIRDLESPDRSVWIRVGDVDLDEDVESLPVTDCPRFDGVVAAVEENTTTTVVTSTTTTTVPESTTTVPDSTTTTSQQTTTTTHKTTTTTEETTTTAPPDTTAPQVSKPGASPIDIWEDLSPSTCSGMPKESTISAIVTDNISVAGVTASWIIGGTPTTVNMTESGNTYTTTFGPFDYPTVPGGLEPTEVTITIEAVDGAGNVGKANTSVIVHSADECLQ